MQVDLTPIINAAIALIVAIISAYLIPWIKGKMSEQHYALLVSMVQTGVRAAEQIYQGSGRGAEKREYVLKLLKDHGLIANVDVIKAMIESAVLGLQK